MAIHGPRICGGRQLVGGALVVVASSPVPSPPSVGSASVAVVVSDPLAAKEVEPVGSSSVPLGPQATSESTVVESPNRLDRQWIAIESFYHEGASHCVAWSSEQPL